MRRSRWLTLSVVTVLFVGCSKAPNVDPSPQPSEPVKPIEPVKTGEPVNPVEPAQTKGEKQPAPKSWPLLPRAVEVVYEDLPADFVKQATRMTSVREATFTRQATGWTFAREREPRVSKAQLPGFEVSHDQAKTLANFPICPKPFGLSLKRELEREDALLPLLKQDKLHALHLSQSELLTSAGLKKLAAHPSLRELRVWPSMAMTDADLAVFGEFKNLASLDLSHADNFGPIAARAVAKLENLRSLNLGYCVKVDAAVLKELAPLKNLETLVLTSCRLLTPDSLKELAAFPKLHTLDLINLIELGNAGLIAVGQVPALRSLQVQGATSSETDAFRDSGLAELGRLANLEYLDLGGCDKVTDEGFTHLANCSRLRSLRMVAPHHMTDTAMASFGRLKELEYLHLYRPGVKVSATGWAVLGMLPVLKSLHIDTSYGLTDAGLVALCKATNLRRLYLQNCKEVTDAGFAGLADLKNLTSLGVYQCENVGDGAAREIARLPNLESLTLYRCVGLTDDGVKSLAELKTVRELRLTSCGKLTDAALTALAGMKSLRMLILPDESKITPEGIERIKTALPGCLVGQSNF